MIQSLLLLPIVVSPVQDEVPQVLIWRKEVAPNVIYRHEVRMNPPLQIFAVRFPYPHENIKVEAALSADKVFQAQGSSSESVSSIARRKNAIAAINGDFFGTQGDAVGAFISNGHLLSEPTLRRSVAAFTDDAVIFDRPRFEASINWLGRTQFVNGVNRVAGRNEVVVFSHLGGVARSSEPSLMLVFQANDNDVLTLGQKTLTLKHFFLDRTTLAVQQGEIIVVVGQGRQSTFLDDLYHGLIKQVNMNFIGSFDWGGVKHAVSGGPWLVKDGKVSLNPESEGVTSTFAKTKAPRTGIGKTAEGEVFLVVVDGRSPLSVGATLEEFATILVQMGCVEAINLDGGGSSALYLLGNIMNRPSDGTERRVANALLLYAPEGGYAVDQYSIESRHETLKPGDQTTLRVLDSVGNQVPNGDVLWVCNSRLAWIDQGGRLTALREGTVRVDARVRGVVTSKNFQIIKP